MGTVEPTGPTAIAWAMETYSEAQGKAADTVGLGAAPGCTKSGDRALRRQVARQGSLARSEGTLTTGEVGCV